MAKLSAAWAESAFLSHRIDGLTDDQLLAIDPNLANQLAEQKRKKEQEEENRYEEYKQRILRNEEKRQERALREIIESEHENHKLHIEDTIKAAEDYNHDRYNFGGEQKSNLEILHAHQDMLKNWPAFSQAMVSAGLWKSGDLAEKHKELVAGVNAEEAEYSQSRHGAIDITAAQQAAKKKLEDPDWQSGNKLYNQKTTIFSEGVYSGPSAESAQREKIKGQKANGQKISQQDQAFAHMYDTSCMVLHASSLGDAAEINAMTTPIGAATSGRETFSTVNPTEHFSAVNRSIPAAPAAAISPAQTRAVVAIPVSVGIA